mmetsp:Transcript_182372/g.443889  ORF Transcript_182372/g.443889 Transcript_182372/m.443889 type:complete len:572 (+) Transcript_182372:82-1797(+)
MPFVLPSALLGMGGLATMPCTGKKSALQSACRPESRIYADSWLGVSWLFLPLPDAQESRLPCYQNEQGQAVEHHKLQRQRQSALSYGDVLKSQLPEPVIALDAERAEDLLLASEVLIVSELVHGEGLEGVADEGDVLQGSKDPWDGVLVEQVAGEQQEEDDKAWRYLGSHLHAGHGSTDHHAQAYAHQVLQREQPKVDAQVVVPGAQGRHGVRDCAPEDARQSLDGQLGKHGRGIEGKHAVELLRPFPLDHLELARDELRAADDARKGLVHGREEEDPGPVLQGLLGHVHLVVYSSEQEGEAHLCERLDSNCDAVAHELSPGPRQQQPKCRQAGRPPRLVSERLRNRLARLQDVGPRGGSGSATVLLGGEALEEAGKPRLRELQRRGAALVHAHDVEDVVCWVEAGRHGAACLAEVFGALVPSRAEVGNPPAGEQEDLVKQAVDGAPRLVDAADDRVSLFRQALQRLHDTQGLEAVQTGRWLICKNQLRLMQQLAGNVQAFALATGDATLPRQVAADEIVFNVRKPKISHDLAHSLLLVSSVAGHPQPCDHVQGLGDAGQRKKRVILLDIS